MFENNQETRGKNQIPLMENIAMAAVSLICALGIVKYMHDMKKNTNQNDGLFQPIKEISNSFDMFQTPTTGYHVIRLNEKQYQFLQKALQTEQQKQR